MLLFLFFLFRDLNLELSLPMFLFWFRKLCRFGCFHAHDKYIIVLIFVFESLKSSLNVCFNVFFFSLGFLCLMVEEEQYCFVENMDEINEDIPSIAPIQMWSSILSNVENPQLQFSNILNVDVSQFMNGEAKVTTWIPHNHMFIYLGFLAINMLPLDFVKLQVLKCIICRCK